MENSANDGKFASRGGRFNYSPMVAPISPPPPIPNVLGTDDFTLIETDSGLFIEVV